jgi:predicted nucleic acid-binding Zn ribbon protein
MGKLEEKLIKKLKKQNLIADIIWFLIFALFAVLLFVIRK